MALDDPPTQLVRWGAMSGSLTRCWAEAPAGLSSRVEKAGLARGKELSA